MKNLREVAVSINVDTTKDTCLSCGSTEDLLADERTTKEYKGINNDTICKWRKSC